MNDILETTRTPFEFRSRVELPLSQGDVWDRLSTLWFPSWLGLNSVPLMVGGPLVKNPGKNREVVGRVLGSALGHRLRVIYTSPVCDGAAIIVQATLVADGCSTFLEIDVENAPTATCLEALRSYWTDRIESAKREVEQEFFYRR